MELLYTFYYFTKMLVDMATLENGLLTIKMNKFFLPLLVALLGGLYLNPRIPPSIPPPTPRPKRKTEEEKFNRRRQDLAQPRDHQRGDNDDDEEEKENRPPEKEDEDLRDVEDLIQLLLKKLERAIDQYQQQVFHELTDLKQRLRIRQ
ncbi:hypothetical protein [Human papillomavirus 141]|uniref:E4 protein n=1 Tax=Human papillomavirus 141 TaxID=1070414 RepID=I3P6N5_9PAPI|nr:hypothetical protein [Human papillomavirus 141]